MHRQVGEKEEAIKENKSIAETQKVITIPHAISPY